METTVKRVDIVQEEYREIIDIETHHNHEIFRDEDGRLRWKKNPKISELLDKVSLNDLIPLLCSMGYDKNSEVYRKIYRDMGYSLFGYWEIFYWNMNNQNKDDYKPNPEQLEKITKIIEIITQ